LQLHNRTATARCFLLPPGICN